MKKILFLATLITVVLFSCRKNDDELNYTFKYGSGPYYLLVKHTIDEVEQDSIDQNFTSIQFKDDYKGDMFTSDGYSSFRYVVTEKRKKLVFIFDSGLIETYDLETRALGFPKDFVLSKGNESFYFEYTE